MISIFRKSLVAQHVVLSGKEVKHVSAQLSQNSNLFKKHFFRTHRGTFSASLGTWLWKKNVCQSQDREALWDLESFWGKNFLKTPRRTFLTNLATSHAVVLETLKLFQPIRGMGSHLEYLMASKRYTSSEHLEQLWQDWWMDMQSF